MVITAFTGNLSAAYVEGKSSDEIIVTTLESGEVYFSSLLKLTIFLTVSHTLPYKAYVVQEKFKHISIKFHNSLGLTKVKLSICIFESKWNYVA